jgi:hypothetical protein
MMINNQPRTTQMNKKNGMVEVSNEMFDRMQVGKSYRFDGCVGRVVRKFPEGQGKSSTGWSSMMPMVEVKWR